MAFPLLIVSIRVLLYQNNFTKNTKMITELMAVASAFVQTLFEYHATKTIS